MTESDISSPATSCSHDWHHCICRKCNAKRSGKGHKWEGCRCRLCGKARDEAHDWEWCKCRICGKVRDEEHEWDGCICKKCATTRNESHTFKGCKCVCCGMVSKNMSDHILESGQCKTCGAKSIELFCNHNWKGTMCLNCGITQDRALVKSLNQLRSSFLEVHTRIINKTRRISELDALIVMEVGFQFLEEKVSKPFNSLLKTAKDSYPDVPSIQSFPALRLQLPKRFDMYDMHILHKKFSIAGVALNSLIQLCEKRNL